MTVHLLEGVPRDYAWGSTTAIPMLLGAEPTGEPVAELWFGDHPGAPAGVPALETTLDTVIAADPVTALGSDVISAYGPHLPYLLKILAAERALSIQVHPTREQAAERFAAGDPNYTDANHKPELLCALSTFEALCGFRPPDESSALLRATRVADLEPIAELLQGPDGLRAAFTAVLSYPDPAALSQAVAASVGGLPADAARAVALTAADFPGDIGVVVSLLLNHVSLLPGEAIFLGAGNVHAYLRGTGVEIMAASDNVLRCGLTPKRIDVAELLRITDFVELAEPRWPRSGPTFQVPVPDFRLSTLEVTSATDLPGTGPRIVLCTAGRLAIDDVHLAPGHAAFVPAADESLLSGAGTAFVASV